MTADSPSLRRDALRIWRAAVAAVDSERLVRESLHVEGNTLVVGDDRLPLDAIGRIEVLGGGKAGAGMAAGFEAALGPALLREKRVSGWLNVPADCVRPLSAIHLHAARPAGVNEPTPEGAAGADEILRRARELSAVDVCFALISGGGSALLPAPVEGVSLADKLAITRHLSASGATIDELNTVRKQLSRIKGGGLARACGAGRLYALIISDVLGDPLDTIASGPTVPNRSNAADALAVLDRYGVRSAGVAPSVLKMLEQARAGSSEEQSFRARVTNLVIGNNALAVDAAGAEAERLGYVHALVSATRSEGLAENVGRHLAEVARSMRDRDGPNCLVSGGEPVVKLVDSARRGKGGRNQQLALAALETIAAGDPRGIAVVSGGTDGEDGPTDAAGAWFDEQLIADARSRGMNAADYLARNDAYRFFEPLGGLIKTGPTHTNVCDVRVVLVERRMR